MPELWKFGHFRIHANLKIIYVNTKHKTQPKNSIMTRSFKKDKRKSCVSNMMNEYDIPNSNQSGYHSKYLKMVGTTIACTFIGILIFINYQKLAISDPVDGNNQFDVSVNQPGIANTSGVEISPHLSPVVPPRKLSNHQLVGFRKRQWQTVQYTTASKQLEVRQKLKNIQLLISDLKYFPRWNKFA